MDADRSSYSVTETAATNGHEGETGFFKSAARKVREGVGVVCFILGNLGGL